MFTKTMPIQLKAGPGDGLPDGTFTAYASVFNVVDSVGDVVLPGAFAPDLAEWKASGFPIPILFGHNMSDPELNLGHTMTAEENDHGLLVTGLLDLENAKSLQVYRMLKGKRINQMSYAYDELDSGPGVRDGKDVWELRRLKVYEFSIVQIGCNQDTEILAVKSIPRVAEHALAGLKVGRSISAKNEGLLREAHEAIGTVLSALDSAGEEGKASGEGPHRHAPSPAAPFATVNEARDLVSRDASRKPTVDTRLDTLAAEMQMSA